MSKLWLIFRLAVREIQAYYLFSNYGDVNMSSIENINVDKWISNASFNEVMMNRPLLGGSKFVPTTFVSDGLDILYVSSIEEKIDIHDFNRMKDALERVVRNYRRKLNNNSKFGIDALTLAFIEYDFEALCMLIHENFENYAQMYNYQYDNTVVSPKSLFNEMLLDKNL